MAVPRLPVIGTNQPMQIVSTSAEEPVRERRSGPLSKATSKGVSFSNVKLGSLVHQPQPGDPYSTPRNSSKPRPLGFIPGRNDKLEALKKLNQLLSPWKPAPRPFLKTPKRGMDLPNINSSSEVAGSQDRISGAPPPVAAAEPLVIINRNKSGWEAMKSGHGQHEAAKRRRQLLLAREFGLLQQHKTMREPEKSSVAGRDEADPDYMEVTDKAIMSYCDAPPHQQPAPSNQHSNIVATNRSLTHSCEKSHLQENKTHDKTRSLSKRNSYPPKSALQYFNFTGQVQLGHRHLEVDRRNADEPEPCERCRLRGTKCSHCLALRTGGGYIIVDCSDDALGFTGRGDHASAGEWQLGESRLRSQRFKKRFKDGAFGDEGERRGGRLGDSSGDSLGGRKGGKVEGWGNREGRENLDWKLQGSDGTGFTDGSRQHEDMLHDGKDARHADSSRMRDVGGTGSHGQFSGSSDQDQHQNGDNRRGKSEGVGGASDGSDMWDDSGRQSQSSHGGGGGASRSGSRLLSARSRPGSTRGPRPGSSMRKYGRSLDHRDRSKRDNESGRGRRHGDGDSGDEDGRGGARGRRSRAGGDGSDSDLDDDRDRKGVEYQVEGKGQGEESGRGYRGNLMKYKRKKDDVKALHATLKELQGIDPLDYLAKYCIIDQSKLPHYQHVFDNVDRDEDNEISVSELDFALKAVNYDLITDAEMNYVHSVLELAGRYRLNFQLFSLVAALSEKVVSLEDMVKRLINKMDFHALEVKMKKCKELFYLLADSDAVHEEGGVVTTSSLGVELQAGGLTQEHVEYVVDRLNHEERGFVEFLDYLTYVPLFVEIHDAIYGNPLDFTRTK